MFFKKNKNGPRYIIAGLGNPGKKYEGTRHNIGFDVIDYIAQKENAPIIKSKFLALYSIADISSEKVLLLKPQTYMNLSGQSIKQAANFYKIPVENIIIIYDDISLDVAKIRLRQKGSAGGHNGIKSIIAHLGDVFPRVKVGVGQKPNKEQDLALYVLSDFSKEENEKLKNEYDNIHSGIKLIIKGEMQKAMNELNK